MLLLDDYLQAERALFGAFDCAIPKEEYRVIDLRHANWSVSQNEHHWIIKHSNGECNEVWVNRRRRDKGQEYYDKDGRFCMYRITYSQHYVNRSYYYIFDLSKKKIL